MKKEVIRYILSPILENEADREECIMEVSLRVWDKIDSFDEEKGSFTAWLTAWRYIGEAWTFTQGGYWRRNSSFCTKKLRNFVKNPVRNHGIFCVIAVDGKRRICI